MKTETNPLKRRRLSLGYSQKQMSELMDITQSQYSRIENGSSDPTKYLTKLSEIFECEPNEIFQGKILEEIERNEKKINSLLNQLKNTAKEGRNIMEISIKCAHAGITTGEWSNVMREVYGEYRAPTGIVSSHMSKQNIPRSEIKLLQKEVNMLEKKIKRRQNEFR